MSAIRAKLALCLLIAIWGYAFWPSLSAMLRVYLTSGYDYQGLIIIPTVLGLIWYKRAALHRITISCNLFGLLLLLLFTALWLFAVIINLNLLEQATLISMLLSIIFMIFGMKITLILYLPLLSLFLLLPIGQYLYSQVQQLFSWLLVKSLSLTALAVYWEKNSVHVGDQSYIISDMLKSLQYLMLYLTFGIAYAFVQARKWYQGLIITTNFIIIPFMLALFCLICLITINRWFDFKISADNIVIFSWIFTSIGLIIATILGRRLGAKYSQKPGFNDIDWRSNSCKTPWFVLIIAIGILLTAPIVAQKLKNNLHYAQTSAITTEPGKIPNWNGPVSIKNSTAGGKILEYNRNRRPVVLSLINSNHNMHNELYDASKWRIIKEDEHVIEIANITIPVTEIVLKNTNHSKIIWSVYYINGHLTNSVVIKNVLQSVYSLSKNGADTGIIAVSTDVSTELGAGRMLLRDFLLDLKSAKTTAWLR